VDAGVEVEGGGVLDGEIPAIVAIMGVESIKGSGYSIVIERLGTGSTVGKAVGIQACKRIIMQGITRRLSTHAVYHKIPEPLLIKHV